MYRLPLTEYPPGKTQQSTAALVETSLIAYAWLKLGNKSNSKIKYVYQSSYRIKHPSPNQSQLLSRSLFSQGDAEANKLTSILTIQALKKLMFQAVGLAQEWRQKRTRERQPAI